MGALEWVFWAGVLGVLGLFVYLGIQVSNEPAPKFVSPAACLHHGGIAQVERSAIGITDLVCRDGAYFTVEAG